jgi:cytosine/adenosine deaminase-related metal-dependent hydrolase
VAVLGTIEAIRSGTTTIVEISANVDTYAAQLQQTGLRFLLAESFNDAADPRAWWTGNYDTDPARTEAGLQRSADLIETWHGRDHGRITCITAPHAPELCSPELFRGCLELSRSHDIGSTVHLSQSRLEVEVVQRVHGLLPTFYLDKLDFLGPKVLAAHCRFVEPSEIELLGRTNTAVSFNSAIAAKRGVWAPASDLVDAGCTVGLGSDNYSQDMVEVLRTAVITERTRRGDEVRPQPEDAMEWGTIGGARAIGMDHEIGSLEAGKKADLFMVDLRQAHLVPTVRPVSTFVNNGQPSDVESVMVDGRWVMKDGKVLHVDEQDVIARADRAIHATWRRMRERYPDFARPVSMAPEPL